MKKRSVFLSILLCLLFAASACGGREVPPPEEGGGRGSVALTVWGAAEDEELLNELFSSFQAQYAGEADIQITYQPQSESNCKDVLLGDLEKGADVFAFADDQVAALAGRHVTMDWSSAWYVYSFFGNTGLEVGLNEDGLTNYCTWNSTEGDIRGVDVAQAMLSVASSPAFASMTDTEFLAGVQNGSVIAGVSGVWNAVAIEEAWGADMGAAKLPTYTCAGRQIQMASFSGCKLIGVNAYSSHPDWAARLAEWIASESNQRLRFERRGQGPANASAANSPEVQAAPAIAALLEQSEFSQLQRVGGKFWDPVTEFAGSMAAGNPSGASLQSQLDRMVEGVTAR